MDHEKPWHAEENRFAAVEAYKVYRCPSVGGEHPPDTPFPSSYVGLAGIGEDAITLPAGHPRAGFFGYERGVTVEDLERGAANTLVILETARTEGTWIATGSPTVRGLITDEEPYTGTGRQFGGLHRQWVQGLCADGSVRKFGLPVDPAVLREMVRIAGEEGEE